MTTTASYTATLVLQALVRGHAYGFDIVHATGLPTGTVYPLLRRLEARGLIQSRWEDAAAAHAEGRPRRRYYAATKAGRGLLAEGLERVRAQRSLLEEGGGAEAPAV